MRERDVKSNPTHERRHGILFKIAQVARFEMLKVLRFEDEPISQGCGVLKTAQDTFMSGEARGVSNFGFFGIAGLPARPLSCALEIIPFFKGGSPSATTGSRGVAGLPPRQGRLWRASRHTSAPTRWRNSRLADLMWWTRFEGFALLRRKILRRNHAGRVPSNDCNAVVRLRWNLCAGHVG